MNAVTWRRLLTRLRVRRRHQRPVAAAARMVAAWDATMRLETRGHLLWLAHQLTEARRAAQAAVDDLDKTLAGPGGGSRRAGLAGLLDALELAAPPNVQHVGNRRSPQGAEQLMAAVRQARREASQLTSTPRRSARRMLTALVDDLAEACETFDNVCNDFCGADLRAAVLSHAYLGGIRWDAATRWPAERADQVRSASAQADAPGSFQIRDDW
ncbi:hypothetical protein [Streptomyces sp. 7N604]|uniref:hypothetical protein n=1 Tax=Streptomyces sp. 7N604 TaxID=3457415 RepID=UPI003FCF7366